MRQTLTTIFVRIKSSDNNMHVENHPTFCALKTSTHFALVPGTRMLWLKEHYGGFGWLMEESLTQLKVIIRQDEVLYSKLCKE